MLIEEQVGIIQLCSEYFTLDISKIINWSDIIISRSQVAETWMTEISLYRGNKLFDVINILDNEFGRLNFKSFTALIATLNFLRSRCDIDIFKFNAKLKFEKENEWFNEETIDDLNAKCIVGKMDVLLEKEGYSKKAVNTAIIQYTKLFNISSNIHPEVQEFLESVA